MNDTYIDKLGLSRDGLLRLGQYGLRINEVNILAKKYLSLVDVVNEREFVSLCVKYKKPRHLLTVPANWRPSNETVLELTQIHGIPSNLIDQLIVSFRNNNERCIESSWDESFKSTAISAWADDPRNDKSMVPKRMVFEWQPSQSVIDELIQIGYRPEDLQLVCAEYKLYWCESGKKKPNWSRHFFWWAASQFRPDRNQKIM